MSLVTIINEILRFLKDNIIRIILGALAIALLTVGARYFISTILLTDQQEAADNLEQILEQEPASFRAIVTIEDGQIFSNPHLYDDYFTTPEVVEQIENNTGVDVSQTLEYERTLELYKTPTYRGTIAGLRDIASGVFTFRFLVGASAEENLAVAQAYRDLLVSEDMPFSDKHSIDIIVEPVMGELVDTETYTNIALPEILNIYRSNDAPALIIYGIVGFIAGIILMSGITFLLRLRKKKITYAFEYSWDFQDQHIVVNEDKADSSPALQEVINTPPLEARWIVMQSQLSEQMPQSMEDSGNLMVSLNQVNTLDEMPREIVIVINSNHTEKEWYEKQMTMARLYNTPLKIIHVHHS